MNAAIRVLVADDHAAIRSGLRLLLGTANDLDVVGEAADGRAAVANARALRPDVVLMDVRMPGMDGIAATAEIVAEGVAHVLVLTSFDLDDYVFGALRAGAAGFLLKTVGAEALADAVRRVARGESVLAPEVTRSVLDRVVLPSAGSGGEERGAGGTEGADGVADLTVREREILACLARGMSNADIAAHFVISEGTVKTHVSRVLAKLGCASRLQAAIVAREAGVV